MRVTLELLRIIFIFLFLGAVGGALIAGIYSISGIAQSYSWLGGVAILMLIFVMYRNKMQFSGWYKGEGKKKLSKKVTVLLVSLSIILLVTPLALDFFITY